MRKLVIVLTIFVVVGCATNVTMTGKEYPSVAPLAVKILFKEKPKCRYEELGFISTPLSWNQNVAIEKARKKAAGIGADYLMIETVHTNQYNDVSVSAIAYKCDEVDRVNVDIRPRQ